MAEVVMSPEQEAYFQLLQDGVDSVYQVAERCRQKGHDPRNFVEIPQAEDMASRVQQLLSFLHERDTANQIRALNLKHDGNRELVAIDVARVVCRETIVKDFTLSPEALESRFNSAKGNATDLEIAAAVYHGVCAGLAVVTEGILVAPLEGVVDCSILANSDGSKCLSINYAGPIRSAGGTGQALSVLLADYLRRDFGLTTPQMEPQEVERYIEEVLLYPNLQYKPSAKEMRSICQEVPVYITGEGVGKEVSGGRDLKRVPTNNVREGMLLVMCEGMLLKAPKLKKYTDQLGLDGWDFLTAYCSSAAEDDEEVVFKPKDKFISDAVAGRPTIAQPMAVGGFRLRYGRSRAAGLAATSIHPASMFATGGFIIAATQMKIERPGKATVVSPCDSVDGPYIQFLDGTAQRFNNYEEIVERFEGETLLTSKTVAKVWDLGEILVPFGEFRENNHHLMPSPYVPEWHQEVLKSHGLDYPQSFDEALQQAKSHGVPMAPEYTAHFSDLSAEDLQTLMKGLTLDLCQGEAAVTPEVLELAYRLNLNVRLNPSTGQHTLWGDNCSVLLNLTLAGVRWSGSTSDYSNALEWVNALADYTVRPRVTYRIGTRMAKPEKVALREMRPAIHGLIPVGHDLQSRSLKDASQKGRKKIQIGWRYCPDCLKRAIDPEQIRAEVEAGHTTRPKEFTTATWCEVHSQQTEFAYAPSYRTPRSDWPDLDFPKMWADAYALTTYGDRNIKGVKGMTSREKVPEHMAKAMLRHKHGLSAFRDGTIRFDMVDMTLTHFKPREIGLTVERARELGYTVDCYGATLESEDQICELRPQDFVAPTALKDELFRTANFTDDLLERLYSQEKFYGLESPEDLAGHLFATLAPHTSGAILCRLIGFSDIKGGYFHPYSVAGRRRNSDGDIDCVILLMDCILNFSRTFLSENRGGQMDAPLILTTRINPAEIDKEALNVDTEFSYTAEAYEQTLQKVKPKDLKSGFAEDRLGTEGQFEGFGFTHDTYDVSTGPKSNPYTALASMRDKVDAQFRLGELLHSVDNTDQSSRLLDRHLLRDMRGNIRAFGQQKVRCVKCSHSYRRPPLATKCRQVIKVEHSPVCRQCGHYNPPNEKTKAPMDACLKCDFTLEVPHKCGGNIIMTVHASSVTKYGGLIEHLIDNFGCSTYNEQKYYQFKEWTDEMFGVKRKGKQTTLDSFF